LNHPGESGGHDYKRAAASASIALSLDAAVAEINAWIAEADKAWTRAAFQIAPSSLRVNGFVNETRRHGGECEEHAVTTETARLIMTCTFETGGSV
jgi:hypothetical protein